MLITVINASNGRLSDKDALAGTRAVNRQIAEDFEPTWGFGATLRLCGGLRPRPRRVDLSDMRGDAILYIYDEVRPSDADGYHAQWFRGVPYGVVYLTLADKLDENWTVTLSHEALELLADPETNLLVQGRSPRHKNRNVYYWYEVCDPVQNERYLIDGLAVSNFVLPLYFTASEERFGRNDFLGTRYAGRSLRSFGVNPGGYLTYFDPRTRKDEYLVAPDPIAQARLRLKQRLKTGRGALRRLRSRDAAR